MEKEKDMYGKLSFYIAFIFIWLMYSCIQEKKIDNTMTKNEVSYVVTVNSPKDYSIETYAGYLLDENKKLICGVPRDGNTTGDWYYSSLGAGMGGRVIPYHLNFTYLAFAEKKFYEVDTLLPADKILAEFRKGYDRKEYNGTIVHETYDNLTIGAAPGGVIVVWLSGIHNRVEICRLQAHEVYVDKNDFRPIPHYDETQEEFFDTMFDIAVSDSVKAEISKHGLPYGRWDKYRERFTYRFVLNPYDGVDKFTLCYFNFYNGEADELQEVELDKQAYMEKAIPYRSNVLFTVYSSEIFYNDEEMLKVFTELRTRHPDEPIDIIITPTFNYDDMEVSVKCGVEEIKLTKYRVEGVWGG